MDKQQKLKIALPLLFLIMAFVWGPIIIGGGSKAKKTSQREGNSGNAMVSYDSGNDLITMARLNERKKARTSYADWGRNPFTLSEAPKAAVLEGILWDPQNPKAIIDGKILGIGDQSVTGEIINIQQDRVTIQSGSVQKVYLLGQ